MENDTVRGLGEDTLVDIWIEGKSRAIAVTRQAIEDYVGASSTTESQRTEFVRTNLGLIVRSATALIHANPEAAKVRIDAGQLLGKSAPTGERRSGGDRRKGDRRQRNVGPPGGVERRG